MKLRLPNKLIAAIVAAATPVLFSTLSTATLGAAAVATLSQQAMGEDINITTNTNWAWNSTDHSADTVTISNNKTLQLNNGSGAKGGASAGNTSDAADCFVVDGGSTLSVWAWTGTARTANTTDKVTIASDITLNNNATLKSEDGSYVFSGALTVNGTAQFLSRWNKGFVIQNLIGDSNAVLRLTRGQSDGNNCWLTLDHENSFAGKIQMEAPSNWEDYYLIITNTNALHNAEVNTGTNTKNHFALGVATANIRALSGSGTVERAFSSVGNALTVNVTGTDNGIFSGSLSDVMTLKLGEGAKQTISGATINGKVLNESGTLTLNGAMGGNGTIESSNTLLSGMVQTGNTSMKLSGSIGIADGARFIALNSEAEGYTYSASNNNGYRYWDNTDAYIIKGNTSQITADFGALETRTDDAGIIAGVKAQTSAYYVNNGSVNTTAANADEYIVSATLNINSSNTNIGTVTLKEGGVLNTTNNNTNNMTGISIGTLNVDGAASMTKKDTWASQVTVGALNGTGNLLVDFGADNNSSSSFLKVTNAGNYSGELTLSSWYKHNAASAPNGANNYWGYSYGTFLEIANSNALSNAVINMVGYEGVKTGGSAFNDNVSLAVNADTVNIAGLKGNEYSYIYSGAVKTSSWESAAPTSDSTVRTLSINTAAGTEYTYSGAVGTNLNLKKTGAGTQIFDGDFSAFNKEITAMDGKLVLGGSSTINAASLTSDNAIVEINGAHVNTTERVTLGEWGVTGTLNILSGGLKTTNIGSWRNTTFNLLGGELEFTEEKGFVNIGNNGGTARIGRAADGTLSELGSVVLKANTTDWTVAAHDDNATNENWKTTGFANLEIGNVTIAEGNANTITLSNTKLYGLITNNSKLTLAGNIAMQNDGVETYYAPAADQNGYGTKNKVWQLVSGHDGVTTTLADGAVVKYGSTTLETTTDAEGNLFANNEKTNSTIYYANVDTVAYEEGSEVASENTTVVMLNGATLEMVKNLATGHSITANSGTLKIDNDVTVDGTAMTVNGAISLAGVGTLAQNTAEMSTLIDATDAAWQGTIDLGGNGPLNVTNLDLSRYGNSGSTVILHGLSGSVASTASLENGTMVIDSAVELKNSPDTSKAAWSIGTHADGASYKFTNTFSGSGNFRKESGNGTLNMEFAGGIGSWTGSSSIQSGVWALTLSGDVTGWSGVVAANNGAGINVTATGDLKGWTSTVSVSGDSSFSFNQEGDKSAATGVTYNANGGTTTIGGTASDIAFHALTVNGGNIAINSNTTVKTTVSRGNNGGTITIAKDKELTITAETKEQVATLFANNTMQGEGTVKIAGNSGNNTTGNTAFEISLNESTNHTSSVQTNYDFSGAIAINGRGYSYTAGEELNIGSETQKGSISVKRDLRLESKAHVNVTQNGELTVGGALILGHEQGGNPGYLNIDGGNVKLNSLSIQHTGDANELNLNSGTLTFTKEGQVVTSGSATDSTSVNLNGGTLKADSVSWDLNHKATIGNDAVVKVDASQGKTATLSGALSGSGTIHATGEGTVNLSGNMENFSGSIAATQGTLQFLQQATSVNVENLTITGQDATHRAEVGVYSTATKDTAHEAGISVSGTLTANQHATLNANLTMQGGSTLDVDHTTGGLTMGSSLTLSGNNIHVNQSITDALNAMCDDLLLHGSIEHMTGNRGLTLFSGVDSFFLGTDEYDGSKTYAATDYFDLSGVQRPWDFVIKYDDVARSQSGGVVYLWMETPEPATATLSLLALAALAARRRRK